MLTEAVRFDDPRDVIGHVKLDLIHPRTGKVLKSESAENFIGQYMIARSRWRVRSDYFENNPNTVDGELNMPMGRVVLLSSGLAETSPQAYAGGQMLGYGLKSAYAGPDTKRGSMISAESYANTTQVVWVWEWATTAGNGIIRSVGMETESPYWWGGSGDNQRPLAVIGLNVGTAIVNVRAGIAFDPFLNRMWIMGPTNLECWDLAGWTPTLLFTGPTVAQMGLSGTVHSIGCDASNVYTASTGTATIRKFTKPTTSGDVTETGITVSGLSSITSMTHDGTYIWATNDTTIFRANSSSGAIERSFTKPFAETIYGMGWSSDRNLLIIGTSGKLVYTVDLDGAIVDKWTYTSNSAYGTDSHRGGITWVGTVTHPASGLEFKDCFIERSGVSGYNAATIATPNSLGSRTVLGAEVEKTNLTGMKLTYTFTYT